jgi:polysaccharide export outer membrane protein
MTLALMAGAVSAATGQPLSARASQPSADAPGTTRAVALPPGYVIGAFDVLSIVFWRDQDMSAEVTVRPDGRISLPLLKDIQAVGLTPEQLREKLVEAASEYIEEPNPTVVVKEIRSRNVFITGNVAKPNTYSLIGATTVMQLIALAGGLEEFADRKHIVIMRMEGGEQRYYPFNYPDVVKRKHPEQNILLKPGDTVVVP